MVASRTEATIYLADQRGCSQQEWHRSYHTFNFGAYYNEHRKSFSNLQVVNDDTLKGGSTFKHKVDEDTLVVLLPLVGTLEYENSFECGRVDVQQCYHFLAPKDSEFKIINPFESELINFLQIWLTIAPGKYRNISGLSNFDIELCKNQLTPIANHLSWENNNLATIGKYDGRSEGKFQLRNPEKGIFIFVIEGAFEVHNRLLQPRDGLALSNVSEVEFEALSNEAIILIIDN